MATSALPSAPAAASAAAVSALSAETSSSSSAAGAGAAPAADDSSEVRTVLHDAQNFNVKHPLYNTWTLWFDNPSAKGASAAKGGKDSWGEEMNKVVSFDSVEEFWGLYNNIIPPSELPQKANYYLFKEGIQPAWEDAANTNGGKWSIQLPREKSRPDIDRLWLNTMLSAIGETLESPYDSSSPAASNSAEAITGIIMSARPNLYRIAIWTRTADESASGELDPALLNIGKHFKVGILGYQLSDKVGGGGMQSDVEFQSHKDSERKGKGRKFVV